MNFLPKLSECVGEEKLDNLMLRDYTGNRENTSSVVVQIKSLAVYTPLQVWSMHVQFLGVLG